MLVEILLVLERQATCRIIETVSFRSYGTISTGTHPGDPHLRTIEVRF